MCNQLYKKLIKATPIINILEEYVKPAVASDGGNIQFISYDADTKNVSVMLQGACSGCPSSTYTLKSGIENMLKEMLPGKVNMVEAINGQSKVTFILLMCQKTSIFKQIVKF